MKNSMKNVILICAMSAVAIMCIGLLLYDYIPSGLTVTEANQYETSTATSEILSDAKEAQDLLAEQRSSTSSTSAVVPTVKTNIVLKEYDISKTDLAIYDANGDYDHGRPNPFAEVTVESSSDSTETPTSTTTTQSDGTFYNSTKVK